MLPSILAKQLQQGIRDYIETTFPMTNEPFAGSLSSMFDEHDAVYHAPYVSVKMPFRKAEAMPDFFEGVELPFLPYVHQQKAYERLTGEDGRSTLIATGTGSGKTECFLNPVLEYCYQHQGEPGIKALIIYPMNALATDQASRIAKAIYDSPKLHKGNDPVIRVGMYVGGGKGKGAIMMMEPNKEENILGVITDHETMINNPPDILLTNYKMLDYLLVRPKDANLWQDNTNAETLKYIVVDEFHTFDGAQGTDLADGGTVHLAHGIPVDVVVAGAVDHVAVVRLIGEAPVAEQAFGVARNVAQTGHDLGLAAGHGPHADVIDEAVEELAGAIARVIPALVPGHTPLETLEVEGLMGIHRIGVDEFTVVVDADVGTVHHGGEGVPHAGLEDVRRALALLGDLRLAADQVGSGEVELTLAGVAAVGETEHHAVLAAVLDRTEAVGHTGLVPAVGVEVPFDGGARRVPG